MPLPLLRPVEESDHRPLDQERMASRYRGDRTTDPRCASCVNGWYATGCFVSQLQLPLFQQLPLLLLHVAPSRLDVAPTQTAKDLILLVIGEQSAGQRPNDSLAPGALDVVDDPFVGTNAPTFQLPAHLFPTDDAPGLHHALVW